MRIAVVSDIHGNLTALEAVIVDLQKVRADLIVQGGDLVGGSSDAKVIDLVRDELMKWFAPDLVEHIEEAVGKIRRCATGAP
jgi:Icc-related predicted phosphoesterase